MIPVLLLNTHMIWMIFIKILKNTIQKKIKKNIGKKNIDVMFADMLSNKELNPILTELFIRGRKLNI